jgi:hypothetical protein
VRWFITKKHLVGLIGLLVAALIYLALTGCIPVTIRPQFDDENKPIAIPVTPTGSISADGTLTPIYPVSDKSPQPTNWAGAVATITGILSAVLAIYGINIRGALGKMTTVARISSELADANANAETDEQVERNKQIAFQKQLQANVHKQTQAARGKV